MFDAEQSPHIFIFCHQQASYTAVAKHKKVP
jgi:hypothetical protein